MTIGPLLQYFCSTCGKILRESISLDLQEVQLREECPSCGSLLLDSLQNRTLSSADLERSQIAVTETVQKPAWRSSTDFQIGYRQVEDGSIKFAFDIPQIDSEMNLDTKGSLCIIGEQKIWV